jgi:hypothetical protein
VRSEFKAWCSRKLSDQAGYVHKVARKAGRWHRFTEGGNSVRIETEQYLLNAIAYVVEGQ